MVCLDLVQLPHDGRVVDAKASEAGKRARGLVMPHAFDKEARGFGEEEHTTPEDDGECELDSDGDSDAG